MLSSHEGQKGLQFNIKMMNKGNDDLLNHDEEGRGRVSGSVKIFLVTCSSLTRTTEGVSSDTAEKKRGKKREKNTKL